MFEKLGKFSPKAGKSVLLNQILKLAQRVKVRPANGILMVNKKKETEGRYFKVWRKNEK